MARKFKDTLNMLKLLEEDIEAGDYDSSFANFKTEQIKAGRVDPNSVFSIDLNDLTSRDIRVVQAMIYSIFFGKSKDFESLPFFIAATIKIAHFACPADNTEEDDEKGADGGLGFFKFRFLERVREVSMLENSMLYDAAIYTKFDEKMIDYAALATSDNNETEADENAKLTKDAVAQIGDVMFADAGMGGFLIAVEMLDIFAEIFSTSTNIPYFTRTTFRQSACRKAVNKKWKKAKPSSKNKLSASCSSSPAC